MDGIQFSAENGPTLEGTWTNPQTGDSFTVKDSFFQDGQLAVYSTDGRMFDYNMLQYYVKDDNPNPQKNRSNRSAQPNRPQKKELPAEILNEIGDDDGMLPEDLELINGSAPKKSVAEPVVEQPKPATQLTMAAPTVINDEDDRLVHRVLDRAKKDPMVDTSVRWSMFPEKQIEMLVDYMGVDQEKIVNYYISKIDLEFIRENVRQEINSYITKHFVDGEVVPEPSTKPKTRSAKKK